MARLPDPTRMAANVEKRSGDPLPRARKVTPAMDSDMCRDCARVARLGQKKSLAAMPMALKRRPSQTTFSQLTSRRWENHEEEGYRFDIAKGAKVEFEIVDHPHLAFLAVF